MNSPLVSSVGTSRALPLRTIAKLANPPLEPVIRKSAHPFRNLRHSNHAAAHRQISKIRAAYRLPDALIRSGQTANEGEYLDHQLAFCDVAISVHLISCMSLAIDHIENAITISAPTDIADANVLILPAPMPR